MHWQDAVKESPFGYAFRRTTFGRIVLVNRDGVGKMQMLGHRHLFMNVPEAKVWGYADFEPWDNFPAQFEASNL